MPTLFREVVRMWCNCAVVSGWCIVDAAVHRNKTGCPDSSEQPVYGFAGRALHGGRGVVIAGAPLVVRPAVF